jgi:crotonobetaine/carnitine-CoA ligase
MVPRYYELVDAMPKTPTEKIRKGVLRGQGLTGGEIDIKQLGIRLGKNRETAFIRFSGAQV